MSTYSPDLRITLITTGDQAGTWGTTTNTNLGTIIEDAISGYATVSVTSASQAFTALDGAADQARNAMIRLTTTTTAAFSVYAPPNSKQYIIWNNSGYTATIYNSTVIGNTTAAGSGVAIADGNKVIVFSDGTNFYETKTGNVTGTVAIANGGTGQTTANAAFNALAPSQASASGKYLKSDGTNTSWDAIDLSTADITGTLPVANGGTGVTTSTGSGNNVLSTSPTLVTPVLGTPTSVTLTNATGLPLTTGVTGTLPVANGGTGVTTSTGTGSVVLSNSPTLVTPALGTPASGTLTNATGLPLTTGVTGTLPIANGGTGITALGTGVQTALGQNVTGSGGMVLANSPSISSPTLTTPALGTPASGVMTNVTGLPLTTGVTGTLPIANGGTGITSLGTGVQAALGQAVTGSGGMALSASPTFTGTPAAPTASYGTNTTQMATTAFVQAALQALYPVGSIYSSTVSTNPGTLFGFGTWVAYAAGRVLIGDGGGFTAGSTGGSADATVVSHTHTATSTVTDPGHIHSIPTSSTTPVNISLDNYAGYVGQTTKNTDSATTGITVATSVSTTGSSATNANLQPYVVVYMWNRTA